MPTLASEDFLPRIDRFVAHWEDAEAALGQQITVPPDHRTRADLIQLRTGLEGDAGARSGVRVDIKEARAVLDQDRDALLGHLNAFNRNVRARLPGTSFERNLPKVRERTLAPWRHVQTLRDMASLWADINAAQAPDPFNLSAGYSLEQFQSDLDVFSAAIEAWQTQRQERRLVIVGREKHQQEAYALMKGYRLVIAALFAPGSALVESLPRLTPKKKRLKVSHKA